MSVEILIGDSYGIYIPQEFCEQFGPRERWSDAVSQDDWDCCLKGPHDNEWYWDAWNNIEQDAVYQGDDFTGNRKGWRISQNGDVWFYSPDTVFDDDGFPV